VKSRVIGIIAFSIITLLLFEPLYAADPARFDNLLGTDWYGVYMQGSKVGYVSVSTSRESAPIDSWQVKSDMTLIVNAMGKSDTLQTHDVRVFKVPDGEMISSNLTIAGGTGVISIEGKMEGGEYLITTKVAGQSNTKAIPFPADYLDSLAFLKQTIATGSPAFGTELSNSYFEPSPPISGRIHQTSKIVSKESYMFNGVPTDVYKVDWNVKELAVDGHSVIDMDGTELEVTMGGGLIMKLEDEGIAKSLNSSFDILADNLIHIDKPLGEPAKLNSLVLKISGIGDDDLLDLKSQSISKVADNVYDVTIGRSSLPSKILDIPISSGPLEPYLKPEQFVQSDADEIVKLVKSIIGDEKNSWEAAKKLNRWVYDNVEKKFTPDISNALQTLHSLEGDCGEHAVLATALMRAAGIPARTVAGLIYWPPGQGFGYHAWIEVFVGDWVMMDPSWGEDIANPTHIALTTGGLFDQAAVMLRVLGRMQIEVAEAK